MERTMRNNFFKNIKFYFVVFQNYNIFKLNFNIRVVQLVFTIRQLTVTIGNSILWRLPDIICDWITIEYVTFCKIWFVYLMFWYLSWCVPDSILVCMWHFSNRKINLYYALWSFSFCLFSSFLIYIGAAFTDLLQSIRLV